MSEPVKIAQHKASADVDVDNGSVVLGFWAGETFVELPKGDIPVLDESEVFYKITPDEGYTFKEILVNDENKVSRLTERQRLCCVRILPATL